ncbi:MAG: DUF5808 domain-containing protein [Chloroflexota bacterium]
MASTALSRRQAPSLGWRKRWPNFQLSLLDTPIALARRREPDPPARRPDKLMSLEFELAGLAVEFKAKSLAGILAWLSLDVAVVAVLQELMRPPQFRTWHGRVAGLIPYDFRKPTLRRIANAVWAPDNPRLFTDTALGVGWSLNLAQLPHVLMGAKRSTPTTIYDGPEVASRG